MARWVLKPVELSRAAKFLGLKHPASVKVSKDWWGGSYDPFPLHILWVNRDIEAAQEANPSWTIWHELGHALQCERDCGGDGTKYQAMTDHDYDHVMDDEGEPRFGDLCYEDWLEVYNRIPWESEANEIACRYSERYPLVTIRR